MYKCYINCVSIADCPDFGLVRGLTFDGWFEMDKEGDPHFHINLPDGSEIKCIQEWFKEFFELVE